MKDYACFCSPLSFFGSSLESAFEDEIEKEFEEFLTNYNKVSKKPLYRNGYYSRSLSTQFGFINIHLPRDRKSFFHPRFLPRYQRTNSSFKTKIENIILSSFSYSSCSSIINKSYSDVGYSISDKTISRYAKGIADKLKHFNSSPLPSSFEAVYLDATYLSYHSSNNSIKKVALCVALGLKYDGRYQVLAYSLDRTENLIVYTSILQNIKNRGVRKIGVIVSDGMSAIAKAATIVFKNTPFQICLTHVERNFKNNIPKSILHPFKSDFIKIRQNAKNYDEALKMYKELCDKYFSFSQLSPFWNIRPSSLFAYFTISSPDIRIKIRTSNPIESLNSHIKRRIRNRISCSSTTLTLDLFSVFTQFNENQLLKHPKIRNLNKTQ